MKKILSFVLAIICICLMLPPLYAEEYNARSCLLMEASTGKILYEKNANEALPPASVTKIMTLLLVYEAIEEGKISLDDTVQVSEYASSMGGSQVYLEPGEEMSVGELLKCVVVASANDAAVALAETVSGSEEAFVRRMNERAYELGMKNTVFKNTNGLDDGVEGHLTSALDIAIMSRQLITAHPEVLVLSSIWMDSIRNGVFGLTNTNRLIRFYRGANGLKTGSTSKAGFCISATALRDGMQLIAVVMASPTRDERNETAKKLLDYGFAGWEAATLKPAEEILPIRVVGGYADSLKLTAEPYNIILEKGKKGKIEQTVYLPEYVAAPVSKGDTVGEITFTLGGEKIYTLPITAAEDADKLSYGELLIRFIKNMLAIG